MALVACAAVAAPAGASADPGQADGSRPLAGKRLSDEFRLSRWAHTAYRARVRRRPSRRALVVTRLRFLTEDGLPEVYLVLRSRRTASGRLWLKLRLPMRPNGRTGWVLRRGLGPLHVVRTQLRVDRRGLRARLYRRGRRIWRSRVGIGAPATPTPAGRFWIRERLRGDGGVYGPFAFGTAAYSGLSDWPGGGVIGIHGTNQPELIPGRPSHGCIRVPNHKILQLVRLTPIGTPVLIR
jgi:L,D-transpeptidase catalytic domain